MNKLLVLMVFAITISVSYSQDTTWVQTLTYDSITTRSGWFLFPDGSESYRKVLMYHSLKCDPATTQDGFDCGEWDYLTYNYLYEHTGLLDSNALEHPFFLVGDDDPALITTTAAVNYDTVQVERTKRVIDTITFETDHPLGNMTALDIQTLDNQLSNARSQYVYTGPALQASGLQQGLIHQIRLNVNLPGDPLGRLTVKMKNTSTALFDKMQLADLEVVYDHSYSFSSGVNTITLLNPFDWDGNSNILVDISFSEPQGTAGTRLLASADTANYGGTSSAIDNYVDLNNDHISTSPIPLSGLVNEVTVMAWVNGDPLIQPYNSMLFEAENADGDRILNAHLPWGNGTVYWDAGNDGTGYDRISKAAMTDEYAGDWNHWAFTKNSATGSMKIFLNGVLWHSGTGFTKPLTGIENFVIGAAGGGNNSYPGKLDEFALFDVELDALTISDIMKDRIAPTHPNYADLLYYFTFDEDVDDPVVVNHGPGSEVGYLMGTVQRRVHAGADRFRSPTGVAYRPDITFVQGTYTTHLEDSLHSATVPKSIVSKVDFQINGNSVVPIDTTWSLEGGYSYTYDANGTATDSTSIGGTTAVNDTLHYWSEPFDEVIRHELGRYITPYGINLELSDFSDHEGFTWVYDVTDYAHLLVDSVRLSAGNQQELIDLRFAMIEGTPPRDVIRIQYPWGQTRSYSYRNMDDDVHLSAATVQTAPGADRWTLRSRLTGHGHHSNTGSYPHCCEWKDNTHYLFANGQQVDDWHIWKTHDCALNPVYPQGGTWLGAREGWCPGDMVDVHETDLTPYVVGGSVTVDYDITPVPASNQGMGSGNYVASFELMEYGPVAHGLDAEMYYVSRPSSYEYHRRYNPICAEPTVIIRNAGSQDLTSAVITYGVSGGISESFTWTGNLAHMEMTEVALPITDEGFWQGDSQRIFTATVSAPNGATDEYADNDSYSTEFTLPQVYEDDFIVMFKANNDPAQNSYTIKDVQGNVVFSRSGFAANTIHFDTLSLLPGCYTFELLDTGNDGLSYWADPGAGSGYVRFKRNPGGIFKGFESEFGRSITHSFAVGWVLNVPEENTSEFITVYPNPNNGQLNLHFTHFFGDAVIEVYGASGVLVHSEKTFLEGDDRLNFDLTSQPDGLYSVQLLNDGKRVTKRVILQK